MKHQKQRADPIIVVVIDSISYSGTTWINLILGCHDEAIAIGPPDRLLNLTNKDDICRVHGVDCQFWPSFFSQPNPDDNFFVRLADYAKKKVIVINNPSINGAAKYLDHPDIWVKRIHVVRDARAIFSSWFRVHPDSKEFRNSNNSCSIEAIKKFTPIIHNEYGRIDPNNTGILFCKYEDVLDNQKEWIGKFSKFIGIKYTMSSFNYWEHDIHPTAGNQGTISTIKLSQNINIPASYRDREFYQKQFERVISGKRFNSETWREKLDEETIFLLELLCHDYQTTLGYTPIDQTEEFINHIKQNALMKHHINGRSILTIFRNVKSGKISPPGEFLRKQAGSAVWKSRVYLHTKLFILSTIPRPIIRRWIIPLWNFVRR